MRSFVLLRFRHVAFAVRSRFVWLRYARSHVRGCVRFRRAHRTVWTRWTPRLVSLVCLSCPFCCVRFTYRVPSFATFAVHSRTLPVYVAVFCRVLRVARRGFTVCSPPRFDRFLLRLQHCIHCGTVCCCYVHPPGYTPFHVCTTRCLRLHATFDFVPHVIVCVCCVYTPAVAGLRRVTSFCAFHGLFTRCCCRFTRFVVCRRHRYARILPRASTFDRCGRSRSHDAGSVWFDRLPLTDAASRAVAGPSPLPLPATADSSLPITPFPRSVSFVDLRIYLLRCTLIFCGLRAHVAGLSCVLVCCTVYY